MPAPSLAERISASFAAWEVRGRGWELAPNPVSLEPPFRPFFLLPLPEPALKHIDDGKRPTVLSKLYERTVTALGGQPSQSSVETLSFEEQPPFPAIERDGLVTRRILVPADFDGRPEVMAQLLSAMTSGYHPVSLEIIGHEGKVTIQIACSTLDAEHVFASVADYLPDASVIEEEDCLRNAWGEGGDSLVVEFGYADEFFLPLAGCRAFRTDPYIPLITALARAADNESLCFQVLFERPRNPWREAILHAVAPQGSALFADAPEFVPSAREKTASPLFACVVRLAARADRPERTRELLRGTNAFVSQFARPGGNSLIPLTNDGYPDELHKLAFINRESFRTGMILSLDELVGLVHLPDATVRQEAFVRAERRTKPLPAVAKGHRCVIGENIHRGVLAQATLGVTERLQHTMIAGASGTGKSTLLVNMIRQDMERGHGLAVLDPHGDLADEVLGLVPASRSNDVVLFDPADEAWPIGFNVLVADSSLERTLLASDLVGVFQRFSTSWGDSMSTVLSNAILAVLEHPQGGTLLHLRRFLIEDAYRKSFLAAVKDDEVLFFWNKEWPLIGSRSIGPILTRLNTFLRPKLVRHIVGQRAPKLHLSAVIRDRRIFIAKLSQGLIGNENAYVLGALMLGKFLQLALSRQQIGQTERAPFWFYLDEAEHFVTPSLASLLTQARKYGVGLTMAFQMLSQLRAVPQVESAVLGNVHTRIAFRVGDDDARKLAEGLSFFTADDLRNLGRGEAIARIGEAKNDFNMRTFALSPSTDDRELRRQAVRDRSRAQWAQQLETLRVEIAEIYPAAAAVDDACHEARPPPPPRPITPDLPPEPTRPAVLRSDRKPIVEPRPLGRGGKEHKYVQHLIKRLAEERGFRTVIEDVVPNGQVDVTLRRGDLSIACEVSVTTDVAQEVANARKCLGAGFSHIWLVLPDRKRLEKLASELTILEGTAQVRCVAVEDLVSALDAIAPASTVTTKTAGGYKVRVTRKVVSYDDLQQRTSAVANVIAKSLLKSRKDK